MTWQTEIGTIVRHLVDDVNATSYSDSRIESSVLVSAQILLLEVDFGQTYTVNVDQKLLSPDPTSSSSKDNAFINLVALKTACMILGNELKIQSMSSIRVSDGPSSIDTTSIASNLKFLYESACKKYEDYKFNFQVTNNNIGEAVISPYSPGCDYIQRQYDNY